MRPSIDYGWQLTPQVNWPPPLNRLSYRQIARQTGLSYPSVYNQLAGKTPISDSLLSALCFHYAGDPSSGKLPWHMLLLAIAHPTVPKDETTGMPLVTRQRPTRAHGEAKDYHISTTGNANPLSLQTDNQPGYTRPWWEFRTIEEDPQTEKWNYRYHGDLFPEELEQARTYLTWRFRDCLRQSSRNRSTKFMQQTAEAFAHCVAVDDPRNLKTKRWPDGREWKEAMAPDTTRSGAELPFPGGEHADIAKAWPQSWTKTVANRAYYLLAHYPGQDGIDRLISDLLIDWTDKSPEAKARWPKTRAIKD